MKPGTISAPNAKSCSIVTLPSASRLLKISVTHLHHATGTLRQVERESFVKR